MLNKNLEVPPFLNSGFDSGFNSVMNSQGDQIRVQSCDIQVELIENAIKNSYHLEYNSVGLNDSELNKKSSESKLNTETETTSKQSKKRNLSNMKAIKRTSLGDNAKKLHRIKSLNPDDFEYKEERND